jgi:transposase-like protein
MHTGSQITEVNRRPKDRLAPLANKVPVVALVERNGRVRPSQIERVTAKNLKPILKEHIARGALLNTDENKVYLFARKHFAGHDVVNRSEKEYSRLENDGRLASTNTVEGYFSILKRGVYRTFQHVGKQHLQRYLSEFDFRYNSREIKDGERAELAVQGFVGKKLMYRTRLNQERPQDYRA